MKFEAEIFRQHDRWYIKIDNIPAWLASEFDKHRQVTLGSTSFYVGAGPTDNRSSVVVVFKEPEEVKDGS